MLGICAGRYECEILLHTLSLGALDTDFRKEKGVIALTHQCGVAK